jgi:hypothetical protein
MWRKSGCPGPATLEADMLQLSCILQEVPRSACGSLTNTTCICSDQPLRSATQECVLRECDSYVDGIGESRRSDSVSFLTRM